MIAMMNKLYQGLEVIVLEGDGLMSVLIKVGAERGYVYTLKSITPSIERWSGA